MEIIQLISIFFPRPKKSEVFHCKSINSTKIFRFMSMDKNGEIVMKKAGYSCDDEKVKFRMVIKI